MPLARIVRLLSAWCTSCRAGSELSTSTHDPLPYSSSDPRRTTYDPWPMTRMFKRYKRLPILVTERWALSWSWCTGSQPAVIHPAVGCHYFPSGLRLLSQPQSITALWPVPSYTACRQIGVNNLPKVVTQLLSQLRFEPTTCWSQVQRSTRCATAPPYV